MDDQKKEGMSRREALAGSASILAAAIAAGSTQSASAQPAGQPNIVYIISDDQGWKDVGFHGSDIKTPNIDKLAATGARLEQHYAQPMCTPTRAALMTGRYPMRYGLQSGVIPGAGSYSLAMDEFLLPQLLKEAGYRTVMSGKWHLGHAKKDFWPHRRGFDSFYGCVVGEIDHNKHAAHGVPDWFRDDKAIVEEGFDNTLFGQEAVKQIKAHDKSKPLFLYLAFTAPHTPFQAPQAYLDRHASISDPNRRAYAAMISVMDDEIGNVLAALDEKGMRENTLIVFQSDNGGVKSAAYSGDTPVQGSLPADNGPYRDGKGTTYEGGTRVVALANWPGKIKPRTVDQVTHTTDWYPTFAKLANARLGKNKPLDGVDVWPVIAAGEPTTRKELVYNLEPTGGAIREGDWKLVWQAALPPKVELFNIAKDPSEKRDLSNTNPLIAQRLQRRMIELSKQAAPPLLVGEAIKLTYYVPPTIPQ